MRHREKQPSGATVSFPPVHPESGRSRGKRVRYQDRKTFAPESRRAELIIGHHRHRAITKLLLVFLLLLQPALVPAQENSVVLRLFQRENTRTRSETRMTTTSDVNFSGDPELLSRLRSKGLQFPIHVEESQAMILISETGSRTAEGDLPFLGWIDSVSSVQTINGKTGPGTALLDKSFRMRGSYRKGKLEIDSIIWRKLTPGLTDVVKKAVRQALEAVTFPDSAIPIGGSFTNRVPMSLQLQGGKSVQLEVASVYTLRKVDGRYAEFDISQKSTLGSHPDTANIAVTGSGTGVLTFDRIAGRASAMKSESTLMTRMGMGTVTILSTTGVRIEMNVQESPKP